MTSESIKNKPLILRRKLPQIYVTQDKVQVLLDWLNSDDNLRKQKIPRVFEEGYIVYYNHELDVDMNPEGRDAIRYEARTTGCTFNQAKRRFEDLYKRTNPLWFYFKWEDDLCKIHVYEAERKLHLISIQAHDEEGVDVYNMPEKLDTSGILSHAFDDESNMWPRYLAMRAAMIVTSVFHYMNIQKSNKPYMHKSKTQYNVTKKIQIEEPDIKLLETPIFDLTKKRITKERLTRQHSEFIRRTEAWNVRGHARHYKSGKVIWVDSYIKGNKEKYDGEIYSISPKED